MSDWCNDKYDCPDGSDEECAPSHICNFDTCHRCSDSLVCLPQQRVCNGVADCPNGEDESWGECATASNNHWFNIMSGRRR